MLKNFFPNKILSLGDKFFWNLVILLILVILIGFTYALFISPSDHVQGDSVRIMYVHVPASLLALACFGFIGIASVCTLVFKIKISSLIMSHTKYVL